MENIHCDCLPCTTSKMTKVEKHYLQLWHNSCVWHFPIFFSAPSLHLSLSNSEWIALVQEIAANSGRQLQTCSTWREGERQKQREIKWGNLATWINAWTEQLKINYRQKALPSNQDHMQARRAFLLKGTAFFSLHTFQICVNVPPPQLSHCCSSSAYMPT